VRAIEPFQGRGVSAIGVQVAAATDLVLQVHGDGGDSVVDLGSNRVLRREQGDLPALLQPDQP
jgi:hypothetical protein